MVQVQNDIYENIRSPFGINTGEYLKCLYESAGAVTNKEKIRVLNNMIGGRSDLYLDVENPNESHVKMLEAQLLLSNGGKIEPRFL